MNLIPFGCCLALWAVMGVASAQQSAAEVSFTAYGAVSVGMSLSELKQLMPIKEDRHLESLDCMYAVPISGDQGISFMLWDERVVRIDVMSPATVHTLSGIAIGDSEQKVLSTFPGRITIDAHAYGGEGDHYLTLLAPDKQYGIRFETYDGKVNMYYAGTAESIGLAEGCS